jgi:anti-sigma regulatory factor (Ser/Thr protein kinase)
MDTDLSAPSLARQTVRKALAGLGVDGQLAEDILLVTSELVSNAVEHGGGCDRLEIDHDDDQVTICVYDRNTVRPEPRVAAPLAPRSRGLRLVNALTPLWGSEACDGGKYVWARFPRAKTTP